MSLPYALSNRQRKELQVRDTRLRICLPAPWHDPADRAAWIRAQLWLPPELALAAIADEEVSVLLRARPRPPDAVGDAGEWLRTEDVLGPIVGDPGPARLAVVVAVVAFDLVPRRTRHFDTDPQWPGHIRRALVDAAPKEKRDESPD